jgi:hypothetical protein
MLKTGYLLPIRAIDDAVDAGVTKVALAKN